jgi:hypothetical protein
MAEAPAQQRAPSDGERIDDLGTLQVRARIAADRASAEFARNEQGKDNEVRRLKEQWQHRYDLGKDAIQTLFAIIGVSASLYWTFPLLSSPQGRPGSSLRRFGLLPLLE